MKFEFGVKYAEWSVLRVSHNAYNQVGCLECGAVFVCVCSPTPDAPRQMSLKAQWHVSEHRILCPASLDSQCFSIPIFLLASEQRVACTYLFLIFGRTLYIYTYRLISPDAVLE